MCAAEHSLGVASDEGDRLDMDESRQEDELLNYEDSTFLSRLPSSVEVSTEPPRELEESFRDELDIGRDAGRVVCLSMRKILKKLKSLCSLSRLYVVSWEEAGETASSTPDQGRALSTERTGVLRIFGGTWQDGSEDAGQFRHDEVGPYSFEIPPESAGSQASCDQPQTQKMPSLWDDSWNTSN